MPSRVASHGSPGPSPVRPGGLAPSLIECESSPGRRERQRGGYAASFPEPLLSCFPPACSSSRRYFLP